MSDYYEILGVPKTASADDIRKAYKAIAKQCHPDMNGGDAALTDKFKKATEAYEVLSDTEKRSNYDSYGSEPNDKDFWAGHGGRRPPFTGAFDGFFNGFFGNKKRQEVGQHIIVECRMTLEDTLDECEKILSFMRGKVCDVCKGDGGKATNCRACNGRGVKIITGSNMTVQTTCEDCLGTGEMVQEMCVKCNGTGCDGDEEKKVKVTIPAGVESGMRFKYPGLGQPSKGRNGDLYVSVIVKEHELFERSDNGGILLHYPATYTQLLFGAKVEVPTLHGKVTFRIPPGTKPGAMFRLAGQGVPNFNSSDTRYKGDQYVHIDLDMPVFRVGSKQLELLTELGQCDIDSEERKQFLAKIGVKDGKPEK